MYAALADLIVIFHFLYVCFAVGGEVLILLGGILKWRWVRNLPLRIVHLAAVALVAVEALVGVLCPLTEWEYRLRRMAGQYVEEEIPFIPRLVRKIIFYEFPEWVFTTVYIGFTFLVVITLFLVRPRSRRNPIRDDSQIPT